MANVDGDLVGGTTDAAALDLDARLHVGESTLPHLEWVVLAALGDEIEGTVDDSLSGRLLAIAHDDVHELGQATAKLDGSIGVLGIGKRFALGYFTFTRHLLLLLRSLGAVLGTALLAVCYASGIESASHDVVSNTGKVFDTTASNQNHRVLLEVVSLTGNV
jgi:hypothetical protein